MSAVVDPKNVSIFDALADKQTLQTFLGNVGPNRDDSRERQRWAPTIILFSLLSL
jgi:hypothetical protein